VNPHSWDEGLVALDAFAWDEAFELLRSTLEHGADSEPKYLEGLAMAAWWLNDVDVAIQARERAFAAHSAAGDEERAMWVALDLSQDYAMKGKTSVSRAWLARVEHSVSALGVHPLSGYLERARARAAFEASGDLDTALGYAEAAIEIARTTGDGNLEMLATHDRGQILVAKGQVDDGIIEMERVMVAASTGELDPVTTGKVYCNMIAACLDVADYGGAAEWSEEAERWCDNIAHEGGYPGICRVRRSEVSRRRVLLEAAEAGAARAADELRHFVPYAAAAVAEIANIHMQRGDLERAETEFMRAHAMGGTAMPGLALLRLAQGQTGAAVDLIDEALDSCPNLALERLKLLPSAVEILLAAGQAERAVGFAEELSQIAEKYQSAAVLAVSARASGLVAAAQGRADDAVALFRSAVGRFVESGLPVDAARTRRALGESLVDLGRIESGRLEMTTAAADLARLGVAEGSPQSPQPDDTVQGASEPAMEETAAREVVGDLDDLVVSRYSVVGRYTRFSPAVGNVLADARQRIVAGLLGDHSTRENHLLWAAPGSGKTFFAEEIARSLPDVDYVELNLAKLNETEMRDGLEAVAGGDRRTLVLIDEVDAKPGEDWPYGLLLPYLDVNASRASSIVFLMAGSSGASFDEFRGGIAVRPKGTDLLSRTPEANRVEIPPLDAGDRVLLAVGHLMRAAGERGVAVRGVERSALYYVAVTPYLRNARQLAEFASRAAGRMPVGEDRVKFDHLFAAGDPENKAFWATLDRTAPRLIGDYLPVGP
jgi:tetratricopeptide (TPR) repeat protein